MSCDPEHRFELALQIGDLKVAYDIAAEADVSVINIYFTVALKGNVSLNVGVKFCEIKLKEIEMESNFIPCLLPELCL